MTCKSAHFRVRRRRSHVGTMGFHLNMKRFITNGPGVLVYVRTTVVFAVRSQQLGQYRTVYRAGTQRRHCGAAAPPSHHYTVLAASEPLSLNAEVDSKQAVIASCFILSLSRGIFFLYSRKWYIKVSKSRKQIILSSHMYPKKPTKVFTFFSLKSKKL